MSEQSDFLKARTLKFALDVCEVVRTFPRDEPGAIAARQLAKSATSTAANYRAACRARSHAEFTSKLSSVVEECDESQFWLEFANKAGLTPSPSLPILIAEVSELLAIFAKSVGTARRVERESHR